MRILNQKELPLLKVKNFKVRIEYDKSTTPSNKDLYKKLADFIKAKENLMVIKQIKPKFGSSEADVTLDVYDNESSLKDNQVITRKARKESKKSWIESQKSKPKEALKEEVKEDDKEKTSQE